LRSSPQTRFFTYVLSPDRYDRRSNSKARSYAKIGEFWDEHGLSDFWKKTKKVKFDVVLEPEATYYFVERICRRKSIRWNAKGVSSDAVVKNRAVSAEKA